VRLSFLIIGAWGGGLLDEYLEGEKLLTHVEIELHATKNLLMLQQA